MCRLTFSIQYIQNLVYENQRCLYLCSVIELISSSLFKKI